MFRGRVRGRGRGRGNANSNTTAKGLFVNSSWQCDCDPRLPAEHFEVKKDTPNKGRWFYTCQKKGEEGCGFFLFDDDAAPRMEAAILANSTTETARLRQSPFSPPQRATSRSLRGVVPTSPSKIGSKRKLPWNDEDNDEGFDWPLTQEEEALLVNSAESIQTPRKAPRLDIGLPTPDITPQKSDQPQSTATTPIKFNLQVTSAFESPPSSSDLTSEVFSFLKSNSVNLPSAASASLRTILDKHALRMKGLNKSCEVARSAIQSRDTQIVKHVQRITVLETDVDSWKALTKSLRARNPPDKR